MPVLDHQHLPIAAVVLTGGSSGIGKSFISHIAKVAPEVLICNLSRRLPDLNSAELNLRHIEADLSDNQSRKTAFARLLAVLAEEVPQGRILLINNAGFGAFGDFSSAETAAVLGMVEVNVSAVLELTSVLLPLLIERGGAVMNIASIVAFQPSPMMATYGATKSFVLSWSHALRAELADRGVQVMAVCPGPTESAFHDQAGMTRGSLGDTFAQTAEQVVAESMVALRKGKPHVVTGWWNKLQCAVSARLPLRWSTWASHLVIRRYQSQ